MRGAAWPKAEAMLAECRVPQRLKPLQDRLLDHAINHCWNAEMALAPVRLGDFHPTHRLGAIAPREQLDFDLRPARLERVRQLLDGHPVNAGRAFVAHHRFQSVFDVVRITDRLHEPFRECRAFGSARRHHRFDLSRIPARGFTPAGHRQVQLEMDWRSRCAHETSGLLALSFNPLRGPFGPSSDCSDHYALC
jgi:hypothetical protein